MSRSTIHLFRLRDCFGQRLRVRTTCDGRTPVIGTIKRSRREKAYHDWQVFYGIQRGFLSTVAGTFSLPTLTKVHFQNYIALCPNHAAMFKHVNESKEAIRNLIETRKDCDLPIVLAGKSYSLYFTQTHLLDLRAILQSEVPATQKSEQ